MRWSVSRIELRERATCGMATRLERRRNATFRQSSKPFSRKMRSGEKYSLGGGGGADSGVHADGGLGSLGHDGGTDESEHGCRVGGGEATRALWIDFLCKSDVSF